MMTTLPIARAYTGMLELRIFLAPHTSIGTYCMLLKQILLFSFESSENIEAISHNISRKHPQFYAYKFLECSSDKPLVNSGERLIS